MKAAPAPVVPRANEAAVSRTLEQNKEEVKAVVADMTTLHDVVSRKPKSVTATKAVGTVQLQLDARVNPRGKASEGAGPWGIDAKKQTLSDKLQVYAWTTAELGALFTGFPTASLHMSHYLENTGTPLRVDVDKMLSDVPDFAVAETGWRKSIQAWVNQEVELRRPVKEPFSLTVETQPSTDVYCTPNAAPDWFYAVGGFTYWLTAQIQVHPATDGGQPRIEMAYTVHMHDRYNWDGNKSVKIAGVKVTDEQLGRLHRLGLAREFDLDGESSQRLEIWRQRPPPVEVVAENPGVSVCSATSQE